ncbi:ABC-type transport auxiliary lipoprotein family protein [Azoarcus indigens]|uniref:Cholesterol transport system auxiliary component n=1 Tax=Azoarcus indigens TaxID=29545 RepID=A0A4R6EEJ5_9RHOO|nr:ABC-type transport auxiliary lipoprotein family protein [Azoarcus indigens]TDN56660.1 cholesterol transport system auxiliary component [Azoarcus indigens]
MNPVSHPTRPSPLRGALLSAAAVAALMLAGCSVLPSQEPIDVYRLPASAQPAANAAPLSWSLRVATPRAGGATGSRRIVVLPEGDRLSVYQGASWSDPGPVLLRDRLIEAFRSDGRVPAVTSDDNALQADYVLDSDLGAFRSEYRDGKPEVLIRLDARLVAPDTQRILVSRRFEVRQPVAGKAVPEVVRAFGAAADSLSAELLAWTIQEASSRKR